MFKCWTQKERREGIWGVGRNCLRPALSPKGEREVEKMTKLEDHLEGIINVYHQYSARLGDFDTLTKRELKQLISKELVNTIKVGDTPVKVSLPSLLC